jgi:uncharacterized protein (DUF2384 family)
MTFIRDYSQTPVSRASACAYLLHADAPRFLYASEMTRTEVESHALETFGDESKAVRWLNRPSHLWGGKTPAEVLDETDPQAIEDELIRIDYGIFA